MSEFNHEKQTTPPREKEPSFILHQASSCSEANRQFGESIPVDSTQSSEQLDIAVQGPSGKPRKPVLFITLDRASRAIIGMEITFPPGEEARIYMCASGYAIKPPGSSDSAKR